LLFYICAREVNDLRHLRKDLNRASHQASVKRDFEESPVLGIPETRRGDQFLSQIYTK